MSSIGFLLLGTYIILMMLLQPIDYCQCIAPLLFDEFCNLPYTSVVAWFALIALLNVNK